MSDLKCPICGGKVRIGVFDDEGNHHPEEYESDPWSGLAYGLIHTEDDAVGECPIATYEGGRIGMYLYDTRDEAAEALNRRADVWIPVSERKPTEGDADCHGLIIAHSTTAGRNTVCIWHHILNDGITTHWMPLPEPPERSKA